MADTPLRVLVVDDCRDNRDSLALLVRLWGHDVRLAADGPSALEASRSFRPHVVFLDIGMPGLDGWELARRLRQQEAGRTLLLVAVTGYGRQQDRARSLEAGLDAHLTKPVDPGELQRLLAARAGLPVPAGAV
jgi:CheY-like chemotaxis protein